MYKKCFLKFFFFAMSRGGVKGLHKGHVISRHHKLEKWWLNDEWIEIIVKDTYLNNIVGEHAPVEE